MMKYNRQVALVDTHSAINADNVIYLNGIGEMIEAYVSNGYEPYMLTLMFNLYRYKMTPERIEGEVNRLYGRFLTEVVRNAGSKSNLGKRPILIGCPDWPVFKGRERGSEIDAVNLPGGGIHFGSILLIPPFNRLKTGVPDHFEIKKEAYIQPGGMLSRIHVKHIDRTPGVASEYVLKSLSKMRCGVDDLIVLPRSGSER
jgi:hypothetical protein